MSDRYDVLIIGGGNAGFGVSAMLQESGKSMAFVESRDFGGTCPNRGCTPKKVLVAAARVLDEIDRAGEHGIQVGKASVDWATLIDREKDMIKSIPDGMESLARARGDVFKGEARFVSENAVEVDGHLIEADNIVVATGSKHRSLDFAGADNLITSDDILSARTQPEDIVFVGGGVVALEFGHVYARAGTNVTILEMLPTILPRMDQDAVAEIRRESERVGISVKTGVTVSKVLSHGDGFQVQFEHEGKEETVVADRVVNGAGRIANVDSLDLGVANISHDGIRIETDPFLRSTTNPSVWVCGDALVNSAQLSPIATYEGRIVGHNIINGPSLKPDYSAVPNCVYTIPALSSVGLTEKEVDQLRLKFRVKTTDMSGWISGRTYAESVAWAKVIVDEDSDRILGAHLVGHQGEELIHLFAMAMKNGITASNLKDTTYAFPTFSSDVKNLI